MVPTYIHHIGRDKIVFGKIVDQSNRLYVMSLDLFLMETRQKISG